MLSDRPLYATVVPTGLKYDAFVDRVDEDLDRSLDPSFHRNPDIIQVQVTHSRFNIAQTSDKWISVALLTDFVGRSNSGLSRVHDMDSFLAAMERINRSADNVRIPTHLNLKFRNLVADTMLVAMYMLYEKLDVVGWTVNQRDDPTPQSYMVTAGRLGATCLYIGKLTLQFACLFVVVAAIVGAMAGLLAHFPWLQASTFTAPTQPSHDPISPIELRPSEAHSTEPVADHLLRIRRVLDSLGVPHIS
jgi:hypothetical protein